MSRKALWFITALLGIGAIYILFIHIPGMQSELRKHGKKGYGTVANKDSHPIADGEMVYTLTFIYEDDTKRNRQVTVRMLDQGRWESLKEKQDIYVWYLPNKPDEASVEGGERMVAPHSSALRFLAWSMIFAGAFTGYMAYRAPKAKPKPEYKVTLTRR